jgi:signal transduction histidine kinase
MRRLIVSAGIALILLVVAADSWEAWQDYLDVVDRSENTMLAVCRALAEQAQWMSQEVDVELQDFALWQRSPAAAAATPAELRDRLNARLTRLPFVQSAALLDRDGRVQIATQGYAAQAEPGPAGQFFTLQQPVHDATGAPAGAIVAVVSVDYLNRFHAAMDLPSGSSMQLLRAVDASPDATLQRGLDPQGKATLRTLERIPGYPFAIALVAPMHAVLRPWIVQEEASAVRTGALVLLAGLCLFGLVRALGRRDLADLHRQAAERRLARIGRQRALGVLAASMAHDFNNVLSAIVGYGELARTSAGGAARTSTDADAGASARAGDAATTRAHLTRLLAAAERARQLVRKVLTFDRERSLLLAPTQLGAIVGEAVEHLRATLPPTVELALRCEARRTWVIGDGTELYQVVMNLLTNAVQAMPAGGRLAVTIDTLEVREPRVLRRGTLRAGCWVRVTIADSGVGIDAARMDSIFEPFVSGKSGTGNSGLGLAVVSNILARSGGVLDMQSEPGAGTRFAVHWPACAQPAAPTSVHPLVQAACNADAATVMIVDDEAELIAVAEELLATLGHEPVGFTSAQAALEAFRRDPSRFDVVLTDERMPNLRGVALAAQIRSERPDVPVILMTAYRTAQLDALARRAGVVRTIDKPLRVAELQAALAGV